MTATLTHAPPEERTETSLLAGLTATELGLLGIALLLPVVFVPVVFSPFWAPKMALLLCVAGPGLVVLLRDATARDLASVAALVFLAIAGLSALLSGDPVASVVGLHEVDGGLLFVAAGIGIWALGRNLGEQARALLPDALLVGIGITSAVAWLQTLVHLSLDELGLWQGTRAGGLQGNPIYLGALAGAALVLVAARAQRAERLDRFALWLVAAALFAGAAQLSGSRIGLFAGLVAIIGFAIRSASGRVEWVRAGALLAAAVVGIVLALAIAPSGASATARTDSSDVSTNWQSRVGIWDMGLHAFRKDPFFGVGPGRFRAESSRYMSLDVARNHGADVLLVDAHNAAVEYLTTTGVIGLIAAGVWLVFACRRARGPLAWFAAVIGVTWLLQPQGVDTTPLLLLALGASAPVLATRPPHANAARAWKTAKVAALVVGIVAAGALLYGELELGRARDDGSQQALDRARPVLGFYPVVDSLETEIAIRDGLAGDRDAQPRALAAARATVKTEPTRPDWWNRLGEVEGQWGSERAAEHAFREALRYNPWSVRAMQGMLTLAHQADDPAAVQRWSARAVHVLGGDMSSLTIDPEIRSADSGALDPAGDGAAAVIPSPWWASAWLPIAALIALATVFIARTSFVTADGRTFTLFDDAMVSMRFARNLAEGHGLVYNAGQPPVEGYTNFLWTLWMTALHLAPVPTRFVPLLVSLSGVALLAAGVVLVGAIARRLAPDAPAVAAVAMWATALYYPLIFWTLRGLEPGLLAVLVQAAVLLAWRLRDAPSTRAAVGLALVLVAGVLTRTDFVLLAGVVVVWLAWPGAARSARRTAVGVSAAVIGTIAIHTVFRIAYYGEALPNTYTLKLGGVGFGTRLARGGAGLGELILAELAVVLVLAVVGLTASNISRVRAALLAALFGMGAAYSVFVGGDAWEYLQYANRYLAPLTPLLFVIAAIGCREIVSWPKRRARIAVLGLALIGLVATAGAASLDRDDGNLRNAFNLDRLARAHWTALVGGLVLILLCFLLIDRGRAALAVGALAGALILMVALPAWTEWARDAGHFVRQNEYETKVGLGLRDAARGEPSVAVVAGGTIPYWSTLPAVDLLGKSDATIARGPNHDFAYIPGHTKWNYRYSICELRPALVAQLFRSTKAERRRIVECGYIPIWDSFYLRADQTEFDRQALAAVVFGTKH